MSNRASEAISRRRWLAMGSTASLITVCATAQQSNSGTGARIYNVRDFGAKGDGVALDTAALQAAIDACHKDEGGTVLLPAGTFLTGTLELKSNVTQHLAAAAKILGAADGKQYHAAEAIPLTGEWTMGDGNVALIFAANAENIAIEGQGTIDGQGAQFRPPTRGAQPPAGLTGNRRPHHLLFYQVRNLTVRDIFLTNSAYHSVRVAVCSRVKMDGVRIHNRVNHNNDGFHFISSQYVHVSNSDVQCQDDACALFGSCKFVTVTNCSFSTRWSVFRFGGGEAENITVSNCLIYDTFGCPIKLRCAPGSRYENMSFSNLVMKNVTGPISIGLGPQRLPAAGSPPPERPGIVRNISFHNIHATVIHPVTFPDVAFVSEFNPGEVKSCMVLNGVDNHLEHITFDNVHVVYPGGGTAEEAAIRDVPKIAGEYFALGVLPAYGLFARKVRGLTMSNVRLEVAGAEMRPAIAFQKVEDAAINGLNVAGDAKAESLLRLTDCRDIMLSASRVLSPATAFLQVEGSASRGIAIDGGDLSRAASVTVFRAGAVDSAVRQIR